MNVVCLLSDTLRRDHIGAYGSETVKTPNIDRLADRGVIFENSYMGSYPCMPARQDLLTGKYNFLWRGWSPLEATELDLITQLRQHGKTSMLITDHYHLWQAGAGNYHYSFDGTVFIRGQENDNCMIHSDAEIEWPASPEKLSSNWEKYAKNKAYFKREEDYFTPQVFQNAMDWLDRNQKLEDFFLMIDLFDPHEPFDPPEPFASMHNPGYEGDSIKWFGYGAADRFSEEEKNQIHSLYCGEIALVDKWFGKFMDKLDQLNQMEDTMIILISDHGFLFGEHNWLGKHSKTLYNHISHTPLIIYHPNAMPSRNQDLVQMPDLFPTILEAMNVPVPSGIHGQSLLPKVLGRASEAREYGCFGVFGGSIYATDGEWVYVRRPRKSEPLYWYSNSNFQVFDFGQELNVQATRERLKQFEDGRFPVEFKRQELHDAVARTEERTRRRYNLTDDEIFEFEVLPDELYYLPTDYEQQHNIASQEPTQLKRMSKLMTRWLDEQNAPEEQFERMGLK